MKMFHKLSTIFSVTELKSNEIARKHIFYFVDNYLLHRQVKLKWVILNYATSYNKPQRPTMNYNEPQRTTTSHNEPQQTTTSHNDP